MIYGADGEDKIYGQNIRDTIHAVDGYIDIITYPSFLLVIGTPMGNLVSYTVGGPSEYGRARYSAEGANPLKKESRRSALEKPTSGT